MCRHYSIQLYMYLRGPVILPSNKSLSGQKPDKSPPSHRKSMNYSVEQSPFYILCEASIDFKVLTTCSNIVWHRSKPAAEPAFTVVEQQ